MAVEIKVPALGESVTEATVSKWLVKAGDTRRGRPASVRARDRQGHRRGAGDRRPARWSISSSPKAASVQVGGVLCHIEAERRRRCRREPAAARGRAGARRRPAPRPPRRQPRQRRRAGAAVADSRQSRRLRPGGAQARRGAGRRAGGDPADRQGRPRDQGRRDGGAVVDLAAAGRAGARGPRCRPVRARAPTARSGCA